MKHLIRNAFSIPAPGDDGFRQILPLGTYPGIRDDGERVEQVFDPAALARVMHNITARGGNREGWQGDLVDREHYADDPAGDTTAYAWITNYEIRPDGLYAQPEWTDFGKQAIEGKRFKFWSPNVIVDHENNVIDVQGAALTNKPNLKTLKPITNRERTDDPENQRGDHTVKNALATLLGISADAEDSAFVDAVKSIQNRAQTAEGEKAELEKTIRNRKADEFLAEHAHVIENKDAVREQYIANPEATIALFSGLKKIENKASGPEAGDDESSKKTPGVVHNRAATKTPAGSAGDDAEKARAGKIRNRANELQGQNPRRAWRECFAQAESENPA